MTYDLSGPYDGWVTWFNSPIYDGGYRFASSGGLVPSLEGALENFLTNGVASGRLGVGIPFYGYVWTGGTGSAGNNLTQPRQSWNNPPTITAYRYTDIMADYYQPDLYQWDASAQAAYLSITNAVATNDVFLSYDDSRACQAKVSYARNNKLGGVMIWELSQDHTGVAPDPLLQAVKQALATPGQTTLRRTANNVTVAFNTAPLGSYEVQWSSNLAGNGWNSLVTTNVTGPGGTLQINDAEVATNQSRRFYRIQTPP
jgi:chitinase